MYLLQEEQAMYSVVMLMAMSHTAVWQEPAAPDARYGNHLQTAHYRHRRGGCCGGSGCYGGGCYGGGCMGGGYYGPRGPGAPPPAGRRSRYFYGGGYNQGMPYTYQQSMPPMYGPNMQGLGTAPANNYNSFYSGPRQGNPNGPAPAYLIVHLPPNASLMVDNHQTKSMGPTRVLVSPPLQPGQDYTYQLTAQVMRNGKEETSKQQVHVRPGQETQVTMNFGTRQMPNPNNNEPANQRNQNQINRPER
jgi:uncharacterized protein (TIGR03000 family)